MFNMYCDTVLNPIFVSMLRCGSIHHTNFLKLITIDFTLSRHLHFIIFYYFIIIFCFLVFLKTIFRKFLQKLCKDHFFYFDAQLIISSKTCVSNTSLETISPSLHRASVLNPARFPSTQSSKNFRHEQSRNSLKSSIMHFIRYTITHTFTQ